MKWLFVLIFGFFGSPLAAEIGVTQEKILERGGKPTYEGTHYSNKSFSPITIIESNLYLHHYSEGGSGYIQSEISLYRKDGDLFFKTAKILKWECYLNSPELLSYAVNDDELLLIKIRCEYPGSGHMYEEEWHAYYDGKLSLINVNAPIASESIAGPPYKNIEYIDGKNFIAYPKITLPLEVQKLNIYRSGEQYSGGSRIKMFISENDGKYYFKPILKTLELRMPDVSNAFDRQGVNFYRNGQHEKAIVKYKKAAHYNVGNYNAILNLGLALLKTGKYNKSIEQSLKVLNNKISFVDPSRNIKPNTAASAAYNIGKAYEAQGDWVQALNYYGQSIKIKLNNARQRAYDNAKLEADKMALQ